MMTISFLQLQRGDDNYRIPMKFEQVRGISAHYEIVDYAEENADMIVIATHGRSGLSHMFMGSTAEKVVQWAKIPVLTTRPKEMIKRSNTDQRSGRSTQVTSGAEIAFRVRNCF